MDHRPDIDGLRALAVVPVVLYHAAVPGVTGGFAGVDVFFVISGFLITQMIVKDLGQGRFSLADFYARRIRRIVPALAVMLLAVTGFAVLTFTPQEHLRYGASLASAALFAANFYFWRTENYFNAEAEPSPLLHTWSLAVEEQFYFVWPLGLMLVFALGLRRHMGLLTAFAFAFAFAAALVLVRVNPQFSFYMLPTRAWELLIGAALAAGFVPQLMERRLREGAAALGVAMVLASMFVLNNRTETPGVWLLLPCAGAALVIHAGASGPTAAGRILSLPPLVWTGLISYSLYLWHWPLLVLPTLAMARALTPVEAATAVGLSVLIAAVSWRFVEQPFRRQSLSGPGMIRQFISGGALTLCVLALTGFALLHGGPWLWRDHPLAAAADAAVLHDPNPPCLMRERSSGAESELPPLDPCIFGADAKRPPVSVLWGDSHANQLRGAMEDWAKTNGVTMRQFSKALCPPLLGVVPATPPNNLRGDCRRFNAELADWVKATPSIRQVILAARWPVYTGLSFPRHGNTPILTKTEQMPNDGSGALGEFVEGLNRTVAELNARGISIVLIAPLPDFFQGVPKCVARSRAFGWDEKRCAGDAAEAEARLRPILTAMQGVAAKYPRVTVVETLPLFCKSGPCEVVQNGALMFRDDNHVTPLGAARIVAKIPTP